MSDQTHDTQPTVMPTANVGARARAPRPKAPAGLSSQNHADLVDLLLQQAAEAAAAARRASEPIRQLDLVRQALERARAVLTAIEVPATVPAMSRAFGGLDAAFGNLFELYYVLAQRGEARELASETQDVLSALDRRFAPLGWKHATTRTDVQHRAMAADNAGASTITSDEKLRLGLLHLESAQQRILTQWPEIQSGATPALLAITEDLRRASTLLLDPNLAGRHGPVAHEVEVTAQLVGRIFIHFEGAQLPLAPLRGIAQQLDSLHRVVGSEAGWLRRVEPNGPVTGQAPLMAPVPRAEPAEDKLDEIRTWTRKVHLRDTNYTDEYLGYVELFMEVMRSRTGQVYAKGATATKCFGGRAGQYLSIGAQIDSHSIELGGQHFCDVFFDVQVGGPTATQTSTTAVGATVGGSAGSPGSPTAGMSATMTFSTASTSQGTRSFRRVFRIVGLDRHVMLLKPNPDNPYKPIESMTNMYLDEREDLRRDFEDFWIDDKLTGGGWTADWQIESYDD